MFPLMNFHTHTTYCDGANSPKEMVEEAIAETDGLELEYYEVVNGDTLQPVATWEEAEYIVGCITVYCGKVRLIDNIRYK